MSPKEKADSLFRKMYQVRTVAASDISKYFAKQCALIVVNEMINEYGTYYKINIDDKYVSYWEQVKEEVEKL
jgi:hypothetical protein